MSRSLIDRLRDNDSAAFEELLDAHHSSLVRFAESVLHNRASAEEVAQETWVAVLEGLDSFRNEASLKTWILKILFNRAKTRAARDNRQFSFDPLADECLTEPSVEPRRFRDDGAWAMPPHQWADDTPERLLMNAEVQRVVHTAIEQLPDKFRAVVTLRDIECLTAEEVCNVLEISESNQRVLLHRARTALRAALEAFVGRRP